MAHGDAREGKWRGNWWMEWVATLHTTSKHGVSSITTADAHTSVASSRLNWRPCRFEWTRPFRRKAKSGFCACAITFQTQSATIIIFFNLRTEAFKAYCAIWVRRSNLRHQTSPRVPPCESTQRRKVKLWAENIREDYLNAEFNVTFRDLLHAVKLRHRTEGKRAEDFFALNIRRLRPGANPQTWIPKASTLPLDHRSSCRVQL
jgi:hypothetical protein